MNNKECMNIIKWNVLTSTLLHKEEHLEFCEQIEKELARLEQAKKLLKDMWDCKSNCYTGKIEFYCTEEVFNEIKEWLENDR